MNEGEIRALASEVAALRRELAAAQSALAQARSETRVTGTELAAEPMPLPPVAAEKPVGIPAGLSASERAALLEDLAGIIAQSESRQDTKFLFTTDQLARSLAMQRREDLAAIERQLRDTRAETFQALLSTHERLDRLAQPAVLDRGLAPENEVSEEEPKGKEGGQTPHEDRLEPRW